jgi:PhnB protein
MLAHWSGRATERVVRNAASKRLADRRSHTVTDITGRSDYTPEGWHTVTPRIVVHHADQLVAFIRQVFGATGEYRPDTPCALRIGDSIVMISDPGIRSPMPAFLYVYVDDTDEAYRRALQAGATSLEEPLDMPYGDRRGMVKDKWGNTWQIATHLLRGSSNRTMHS